MLSLSHDLKIFFARNIFERLIIYIFLSELAVKIIFELGLGQWSFQTGKQKQYIFFSLILLDYAYSLPALVKIGIRFNYISNFLIFFLFVIVSGIFVGIANHNKPFEIFNDSIPLILMVLNALRMQSIKESQNPIDFDYLLKWTTFLGALICFFGFTATSIGLPSTASIGGLPGGIYYPLIFAALLTERKLSRSTLFVFLTIVTLSSNEYNRTTMSFFALMLCGVAFINFKKSPVYGIFTTAALCLLLSFSWAVLPEDSSTYKRLVGLVNIDFSAQKGSVGERGQEFRSISTKLESQGPTSEWLGLGHGGLYEVRFTHQYVKDYGHAHYSWALFKLRYGNLGYFYLAIMAIVLLTQVLRNWSFSNPVAMLISLICVQSILYLGTYVNFVLLLSGIPFLYLAKPALTAKRFKNAAREKTLPKNKKYLTG